jgi:tRNA A-37 threonylcarbamoyl transferase component Bud32
MIKRILAIYLVAFLALPVTVFAEDIGTSPDYVVLPIEAGDIVPFDGILLSLDAAAKIITEKKFEGAECDLRIEYELQIQEERYTLQLDYKDIEITSWKDRYESMMILKSAENDRLTDLVIKQRPGKDPFMIALGFGIGTLTSLGIFALSTEIVKQ